MFVQQWRRKIINAKLARWNRRSTELIGEDITLVYEEIKQEIEDGQGERVFDLWQGSRGKTTIAEFIANEFASQRLIAEYLVVPGNHVGRMRKMDTMYVQSVM